MCNLLAVERLGVKSLDNDSHVVKISYLREDPFHGLDATSDDLSILFRVEHDAVALAWNIPVDEKRGKTRLRWRT
jgi:hypothetical protein